jgi:uncharacterized protein
MSPPPSSIPAGWFPDPGNLAGLRYWDGRAWTPYTSPIPEGYSPAAPAHPTLPIAAAIGAVLITVVSLIGSRFILDQLARFDFPIPVYVALAAIVGYGPMVIYCIWASKRWGTGSVTADLGLKLQWVDAGWGPVTYLVCLVCQLIVGVFIYATKIPLKSNTEGLDRLAGDRDVLVAFLITAVVVAPIVEEMVFRGVVLRGLLSRLSPVLSIGLQGTMFGLVHLDPARGIGNIGLIMVLSVVGIVLGAAAFQLRRIGTTMIAHGIYNGVAMIIVLLISN